MHGRQHHASLRLQPGTRLVWVSGELPEEVNEALAEGTPEAMGKLCLCILFASREPPGVAVNEWLALLLL